MSVTETLEPPAVDCPSWCCGGDCEDTDTAHVNEYEGVDGARPDDEALARLMQDRDGDAVIELGVNDTDGDSAAIRLTPEKATELAYLILDLVATAKEG